MIVSQDLLRGRGDLKSKDFILMEQWRDLLIKLATGSQDVPVFPGRE